MTQTSSNDSQTSCPLADGEGSLRAYRIESKARIRFAVEQALAQGRMVFHYQPVVRADCPEFPAFFEMLARLRLPNGQMLPAGAFMPVVEEGLLGRAIDRLVLSRALEVLAAEPTLRLSVNMSPLSMGDVQWLTILAAAGRDAPSACRRLIIEITETAAMQNSAQTVDFMNFVRGLGCAFALDDFGAGATGFRNFRDFRFDMVKIDGSFVQGISESRDSQVLVECLMAVAKHFEMFTIAERVETEIDADWLRSKGIDCLQGYLYGKPQEKPEMPSCESGARDRMATG